MMHCILQTDSISFSFKLLSFAFLSSYSWTFLDSRLDQTMSPLPTFNFFSFIFASISLQIAFSRALDFSKCFFSLNQYKAFCDRCSIFKNHQLNFIHLLIGCLHSLCTKSSPQVIPSLLQNMFLPSFLCARCLLTCEKHNLSQ